MLWGLAMSDRCSGLFDILVFKAAVDDCDLMREAVKQNNPCAGSRHFGFDPVGFNASRILATRQLGRVRRRLLRVLFRANLCQRRTVLSSRKQRQVLFRRDQLRALIAHIANGRRDFVKRPA